MSRFLATSYVFVTTFGISLHVRRGRARARRGKGQKKNGKNGANLEFEQTLCEAADELRGNTDAADYQHVVLGLIFLKYISDAFQERF